MNLADYFSHDALGLAALIRSGEVSRFEVIACARDAIEAIDGDVQAVIETYDPVPSKASPEAPLYGVPFLLKDVGAPIPGLRQECGSRLARGMIASRDNNFSKRYLAAGLQIIGRTKSPEMAFNLTTENRLHGAVHNPWDLARSAGGSSGGAGAATAARMVPMAEANDGGGSIRIPASCNGVVGLKPSRGRISSAPDAWEYLNGLSAPLVTSRTVRDSAAMLDVMQGAEPGDPYPVAPPAEPYLDAIRKAPRPLKIALITEAWTTGLAVDPACARAATEAAELCEDLGHQVTPQVLDIGVSWDAFVEANARVWCTNIARWADGLAKETGRAISHETLEATTLACTRYGKAQSADHLLEAFEVFNRVSRAVGAFHQRFDLVLSPTLPKPPQPLGTYNADREDLDGLGWTNFILSASPFTPVANVTGQPAISLPLGWMASGLPVGVQFMAAIGAEDTLLKLSAQIEDAKPWINKRPKVIKRV